MKKVITLLVLLLTLFTSLQAKAQHSRVALVVGNQAYQSYTQLSNPVSDAKLMKQTLEKMGFKVIYLVNAQNRTLKKALQKFSKLLDAESVGLFYFAGHGIEINGHNYLLGVDTLLSDDFERRKGEAKQNSLALQRVVETMQAAKNRLNIVVLDACRKDPDQDPASYQKNTLAPYTQTDDLFIAYATQAGEVASDGPKGANGLFTQELVQQMQVPNQDVEQVFKKTREAVYVKSHARQRPTTYSSILGSFYFTTTETRGLKRNTSSKVHFVKRHKRYIEPKMALIPAGPFLQGDNSKLSASPQHKMNVAKPFYISIHETTFAEYDLFSKDRGWKKPNDHGWGRGMQPVINVTWYDAKAYCHWLSQKTGKTYRLPTESEWEYVARTNSKSHYGIGDNDALLAEYAWYKDNANGYPHEVGSKLANSYGLFDILGNVQEWVEDDYLSYKKSAYRHMSKNAKAVVLEDNSEKVVRGGSWFSEYDELMVYLRDAAESTESNNYTGFRIVKEIK